MIESHITEHDSEGSGPEHKVGLGGKARDCHESNRNNQERHYSGQDSDWKSKELQDSEKKSKEQHDSKKKLKERRG